MDVKGMYFCIQARSLSVKVSGQDLSIVHNRAVAGVVSLPKWVEPHCGRCWTESYILDDATMDREISNFNFVTSCDSTWNLHCRTNTDGDPSSSPSAISLLKQTTNKLLIFFRKKNGDDGQKL